MKKNYLVALPENSIRVSVGTDLEIDDGYVPAMWSLRDEGILVSTGTHGEDATSNIVQSIADLTILPAEGIEPLVRFWLSELLGVPRNRAIEKMLLKTLPILENIYERHPTMAHVSSLSARLYASLRSGDTPRAIACSYFKDACTRSDGIAFIDGLCIADSLDESRVSLMVLAAPGDHRKSLANVPSPRVWAVPPAKISVITSELSVPVAMDFARVAIGDSRSRLALNAALHLGLKARGADGETAYRELCADVMRTELSAPHSILEQVVAMGPIADLSVMPVKTERQLRKVAEATGNCVANPRYAWRNRVLRGEVEMFALANASGVSAVIAIDPKSGKILEKKGKNNAELDAQISEAVNQRLLEVGVLA